MGLIGPIFAYYKIRDSKTQPLNILRSINPFFKLGLQNMPNNQNHILAGKLAEGSKVRQYSVGQQGTGV